MLAALVIVGAFPQTVLADRRLGIQYFAIATGLVANAERLLPGEERIEILARVAQILRIVASEHNDSPAGLALSRNRPYRGIDLAEIEQEIEDWKQANADWREPHLDIAILERSQAQQSQDGGYLDRPTSAPPSDAGNSAHATTREPGFSVGLGVLPPAVVPPVVMPVVPPQVVPVAPLQAVAPPAGYLSSPNDTTSGARASTVATAAPMSRSTLLQRLEKMTVLVDAGDSTGTGFFVADNLVMTNAHVVSFADTRSREAKVRTEVKIVNEHVGIRGGRVVYVASMPVLQRRSNGELTTNNPGLDVALIQLPDFRLEEHFRFSDQFGRNTEIIVPGFPKPVLQHDLNYHRYLRGDAVAPGVAIAPGHVMAITTSPENSMEMIQHSTRGAGGSSGSPIVNSCGQVIGIHFMGDLSTHDRFAFGYSAREILRDLKFKGYDLVSVDPVHCD